MPRIRGLWPLLLLLASPAASQVRVWQDSITLPTYVEYTPDVMPPLEALTPDHAIYPYTSRVGLGRKQAPEEWRRINLENEYLACTFLPDLGRLYTCTDKLNGHPLFYANPSIKKALIGPRGTWVALGIEMSFPLAHSLQTVSPSDFGFRQGNGIGAVWIGQTDRVSGMEMLCEFVLRAGSAVLEQNVTLSNPTPVRHRYHWWNNAAIELETGTRAIMPARVRLLHGTDRIESWPVNAHGVDESQVANNREMNGYFALGSHEPFLAIYHGGSRTATVHVADPEAVPGKKFWTWGTKKEKDAEIRQALSDNNSQYVEIQTGVLPTQEEFRFLEPYQSLRFTESWLAARGLGGISRATVDGVLNLERRTSADKPALVAELNVTHAIPHATIRIRKGAEVVLEETADLDPAAVFMRSIPSPAPAAYRFELADGKGNTILAHTENEYRADASATLPDASAPGERSPEDVLLERGAYNELQGLYRPAEAAYRTGLEKFPASIRMKTAAGRLLVSRNRAGEALPLLTAAASEPGNSEAHYYLGLAQAALGHEDLARAEWREARSAAAFDLPARVETAASLARTGATAEALIELSPILERPDPPAAARRMQVALLRQSGKTAEARESLARWLALDPADTFLRWESVHLGGHDETLDSHLGADPERTLDLADAYLHLGLPRDALAVLDRTYPQSPANHSEPGAVLPQKDPLVVYYRGYLRAALNQGDAAADFRAAAELPLSFIFPHRASSLPVLQKAVAANPDDSSAHWLLGLLDADCNLLDAAIAEWQKVPGRVNPLAPTVLRQMAASRQKSLGARPDASASAASSDDTAATALLDAGSGNLDAAMALFTPANFPAEKQSEFVRNAYFELRLQQLRAKAASGQCEAAVGGIDHIADEDRRLPFTFHPPTAYIKSARFQYYLGEVEAVCRETGAARKRWTRLAKSAADPSSLDFAFSALSATRLNDPSAKKSIGTALAAVEKSLAAAPADSRGILLYTRGLLLYADGQTGKALASLQEGALTPNSGMSAYLNLVTQLDLQ